MTDKRWRFPPAFLTMLLGIFFAGLLTWACVNEQTRSVRSGSSGASRGTVTSNSTAELDDAYDAAADDDSVSAEAPTVGNVIFNPPSLIWNSSCESTPCVEVQWNVCDLENDLEGGNVYFYAPDTTDPFIFYPAGSVPWADYNPLPDVSLCDPVNPDTFVGEFTLGMLIPESTFSFNGTFDFYLDMEADDGAGNLGEIAVGMLEVTYYGDGGDDDTTSEPPSVGNVTFIPSSLTWTPDCETTSCVTVEWYVCDTDNDLEGGSVYFYDADTIDPFIFYQAGSVPWANYNPLPDVSLCDPVNPGTFVGPFSLDLLIPEAAFPGPGTSYYFVDIMADDAEGNTGGSTGRGLLEVTYSGSGDDDTTDCDGCDDGFGVCGCLIEIGCTPTDDDCTPEYACFINGSGNPDNDCQVCDWASDPAGWTDAADGQICADDGVFCNGVESCLGGTCSGHSGDECEDDGNFCNGNEVCNEDLDICESDSTPEEVCPDDGLYCNGEEICFPDQGCVRENPPDCADDGFFCNGAEYCDEGTEACESTGDPCGDDGLFCNGSEECDWNQNACVSLNPPCFDDGVLCNGTEVCEENGGSPICNIEEACPDDDVYCNGAEYCDDASDACAATGDPCEQDPFFCNGVESCSEALGECVNSGDPCPDDGIFCNGVENCEEDTDSCENWGDPCPDDGVLCNGIETCEENGGSPICDIEEVCPDDGVFCNGFEYCDDANDTCATTGDPCAQDPFFCNGVEVCDELLLDCTSTGDPCPDDGLFCNGVENCDEDTDSCESLGDPCPDDGVLCNGLETCDEDTDECGSDDPCPDDEIWCNGDEACDWGGDECAHLNEPCEDTQICDENQQECLAPSNAPLLSNGAWASELVIWDPSCEEQFCAVMEWYVCDPQGDLIGGDLYFYLGGTGDDFPWFGSPVMAWEDILPPEANGFTNCDAPYGPVRIGLLMPAYLFPGPGLWEVVVDLRSTDAAGNWSNLLEGIRMEVLFDPDATTTTTVSTTTTTQEPTTTTVSTTTTTQEPTTTTVPATTTTTTTAPGTTTTVPATSTTTTGEPGTTTTTAPGTTTTVTATSTTTTTFPGDDDTDDDDTGDDDSLDDDTGDDDTGDDDSRDDDIGPDDDDDDQIPLARGDAGDESDTSCGSCG